MITNKLIVYYRTITMNKTIQIYQLGDIMQFWCITSLIKEILTDAALIQNTLNTIVQFH